MLCAVTAVLAVLISPLPAVADAGVTIDVTVIRVSGLGVEGVLVSAFRYENDRWQAYASESAPFESDTAQVRLEVPAGGEYRVCAQDPANAYVMTCYGGGISPDDEDNAPVPLAGGHGSVTLQLRAPTAISGTVHDDRDEPIAGAAVRITRAGSGGLATVYTETDGTYQLPVNEGSYLVAFDADGHVAVYYDDVADPEDAELVSPTEDVPAEHVDARLDRLATISGQVATAGLTEDEMDGLAVVALDGDDEVARDDELVDGNYTLGDLVAGDYRVCVAESVAVAAGTCLDEIPVAPPEQVTGADLTPKLKGRIIGTVTGADDEPLAGVTVTAFVETDDDWRTVRSVTTAVDGGYALRLDAGLYKIRFSGAGHQREFYDDVAILADADLLAVTDEHDTIADAELEPGGTISGTIAGPTGDDLAGIRVVAYADGGSGGWQEVADAEDLSGNAYAVGGLPPGAYRVCAVVQGVAWRAGCVGGLTVEGATDIAVAGTESSGGHTLTLQPAGSSVVLTDLVVQGTPVVGQTLTVSATRSPSSATVTWTWKRDGTTVGTGAAYVVAPADVSHTLVVEGVATATSMQPWEGIAGQLGPVTKAVFAATPAPAIAGATGPSGEPRVGDTLQAVTGAWSPAPDTVAYQWLVGGQDAGSGATYQVSPGDEGKPVLVRVLGARAGYEDPDWLESPATADVLAAPVLQAVRSAGIGGAAVVGGRLTAVVPVWSPADVTSSYEWRLAGKVIGTGPSVVVPVAARGATLQLTVAGSRPGSAGVSLEPVSSPVIGAGLIAVQAAVKVKGKAKVGKKLKYAAERTAPVASTRSYQWLRNGKPIKKATKPSYKLTKKDKGKRISLRVALGATGYQPLILTSTRTAKVKAKAKK